MLLEVLLEVWGRLTLESWISHFSDKGVRTKPSLLGGPIDSGFAERPEESAFHNHCCNVPLFEHFHFPE